MEIGHILMGLKLLTIIPLGIGMYFLFEYIERMHLIKNGVGRVYAELNNISKYRQEEAESYRELYGNRLNTGILARLDEKLIYSNLFRKYSFLSTELFVICMLAALTAAFILTMLLFRAWHITLISVLAVYLVIMTWLDKLCAIQYKRTGSQMISFINVVSNYAGTTDDLINILDKTASEMAEPLRSAIYDCCERARRTGDTSEALKQLEETIEYPFFKTVIRNLELASRNEANYMEIVNDCREMLQNNLDNEKELEDIYRNGSIELVLVLVLGAGCIYVLIEGLLNIRLAEFFKELKSSALGVVTIIYSIIVVFAGLYNAFIKDGGAR